MDKGRLHSVQRCCLLPYLARSDSSHSGLTIIKCTSKGNLVHLGRSSWMIFVPNVISRNKRTILNIKMDGIHPGRFEFDKSIAQLVKTERMPLRDDIRAVNLLPPEFFYFMHKRFYPVRSIEFQVLPLFLNAILIIAPSATDNCASTFSCRTPVLANIGVSGTAALTNFKV